MNEQVYDYLIYAATLDLDDLKGHVRDGIRAACYGGVWQAVVLGLCGLELTKNDPVTRRLRIEPFFDAIGDGYCVVNHKPAPDLFIWVAGRLGLWPTQCRCGSRSGRRPCRGISCGWHSPY
ncbi:MAG: hypothetical protein HY862_08790 [Chloroflexi bacterium]|nr:hypothetical protein [Chloroflexota bacterium]